MDYLLTELRHLHTRLNKPLETMTGTLIALRKEADNLKSRIDTSSNAGNVPTAQLDSIAIKAEQILPQKAHALRQAEQGERAFFATHNLIDKTTHPNPVVSVLSIAICVFIDAGINSSFLYNAHMVSGPFVALLVSFLISLTNVVLSVCGGYFIGRFLNYGSRSTDAKAQEFKAVRDRARWQFRVFIGVMAFFILTVGLVRSTESLDRIGHSFAHYHELIVTPEAVFLVLLNICIAVFSYNKGRTGFAHPDGDYSVFQRNVTTTHDDLYQCYGDLTEEVEDVCASVEDDAETRETAQAKLIKDYDKKVTECRQACRALQLSIHTAENEFSAAATRIINTHSVLEGKSLSIPDSLLDHFKFVDAGDIELPEYYRLLSRSSDNLGLVKAKAAALKRLSEIFKRALQS